MSQFSGLFCSRKRGETREFNGVKEEKKKEGLIVK